MPLRELLTSGQVAQRAGVDRSTVHHWAKDGKLAIAEVVNGMRLFASDDVDRLIADRAAEAAS
jgi:DNA-binding transcriptional MerR regulator